MKLKGRYTTRSRTRTNGPPNGYIYTIGDDLQGHVLDMQPITGEELKALQKKFTAMQRSIDATLWTPQPPMAQPYSPRDAEATTAYYRKMGGIDHVPYA